MANKNDSKKISGYVAVQFYRGGFRLSIEELKKQASANAVKHLGWPSPTLKFVSFRKGILNVLNNSENRSYKLALQVYENNLLVCCGCGNEQSTICEHAYAGLFVIIWHLGEQYFEKLRSGGLMTMAFVHKKYFDKKESIAGLDVAARPEQGSIFFLAPKIAQPSKDSIFKLPVSTGKKINFDKAIAKHISHDNDQSLAYLLIISARNKLLPALMPCIGLLNKKKTAIKSFSQFLSGIQKKYSHLLSANQADLNLACYQLWKIIEKQPGCIIQNDSIQYSETILANIFEAWKKIFPLLQMQRFAYSYYLFGIKELKRRPQKSRIRKIILSAETPELRFVVTDKGAFYHFLMEVWVNKKLLKQTDIGTTFFITENQTVYMLASLRDAAMAEWIHRSGGWITIFKEHFDQFEEEILTPLQQCYPVERKKCTTS